MARHQRCRHQLGRVICALAEKLPINKSAVISKADFFFMDFKVSFIIAVFNLVLFYCSNPIQKVKDAMRFKFTNFFLSSTSKPR